MNKHVDCESTPSAYAELEEVTNTSPFVRSAVAIALTLALSGCFDGGNDAEDVTGDLAGEEVTGEATGDSDGDTTGDSSDGSASGENALEFGDEYWASLAANYPPYRPIGGAAGPPESRILEGQWGDELEWPIIATGAANMPDGTIMAWASWEADNFGRPAGGTTGENTHAVVYNPVDDSFSDRASSTHDMFCSGVSMLADGSVFLAGGGQYVSSTSVFSNGDFSEVDSLNQTRWYPTSTTLASGQVVTSLGNIQSPYPELWTSGQGWDLLENVSLQSILDETDILYRDWYPALNVAPDGSLFHPGHMEELFSVDLDGNHDTSVQSHGDRDENSNLYNTTVMYDVGKMLVAGGGFGRNNPQGTPVDGYFPLDFSNATDKAFIMDLNGDEPVVTPTGTMLSKRSMQNSVVLPDGKVVVIGGTREGVQFNDRNSVHNPEIWDPATGEWNVLAYHATPRNYHSIAILLKDATVLSAGGGLCGACPSNYQSGQIYTPPYLFDAEGLLLARPSITGGDAEAFPGDTIAIQGSDDITRFTMVRLVAITHHHTTDQRLIPTEFTKTGAGEYSLDLHANGNVLIPGYYWVFGMNEDGTPTTGHTVQVKITPDNVPPAAALPIPKIAYEYYEENFALLTLPNFDAITPVETGFIEEFSLSEKERNDHYAFRFRGKLNVENAGDHTFFLASDDGSRLLINGEVVVDHNGGFGFESAEATGTVNLPVGTHFIELQYFEGTGGEALLVSIQTPTTPKRPLVSGHLADDLVIAVTPAAGTEGAIEYAYYVTDSAELPNFNELTAQKTGLAQGFDDSVRDRNEKYGFVYTAGIKVEEEGEFTFYTTSGGKSTLAVNGAQLLTNDGADPQASQEGTVTLPVGTHALVVEYYADSYGDSLAVEWNGPNFERQAIPLAALSTPAETDGATAITDAAGTDTAGDTDGADDAGTDTGDVGADTGGTADAGAGTDTGVDTDGAADAGADTGGTADAGVDTGTDAGADTGGATDAGTDTGGTTGADTDAGEVVDAGADTGGTTDTGTTVDAGTDTGATVDAGTDTVDAEDGGTVDGGAETGGTTDEVDAGTDTDADADADAGTDAEVGGAGAGDADNSAEDADGGGGSTSLLLMLLLFVGLGPKLLGRIQRTRKQKSIG